MCVCVWGGGGDEYCYPLMSNLLLYKVSSSFTQKTLKDKMVISTMSIKYLKNIFNACQL